MSFLNMLKRVFVYQHKYSKVAIKEDRIIVNDENGITESVDSGWRYTPSTELEKVTVDVQGPYEMRSQPMIPPKLSIEEFNNPVPLSTADTQEVNKATYFFGIDLITSHYRVLNNTNGMIFKNVSIGRCSFIELAASMVVNESCSVEFYIIDGTKEVPILPVSCDRIVNEKLFFNMNPRFSVDVKKDIEVKKNGQIIQRTISGLENLDLQDGLYTISYTPTDAYRYFPESESINIKVIQRMYDEKAEPSYVKNLLVRKYGGGIPWAE